MDFSYRKNNNEVLFKSLENNELLNVMHPQNYNPLYQKFFTLNEKNYDKINLNETIKMSEVKKKKTYNKFICHVENDEKKIIEKQVFFKFSPLLDPLKYVTGKYDASNENLLNLPDYYNKSSNDKIADSNNAAYVDGFFTYLTSKLLHKLNFVHAIDYYGSFLGIKRDFIFDISDDIEYLNDSTEFHKNNGVLYEIDNTFYSELINYDTRKFKQPLVVSNTTNYNDQPLELSDITDLSELNDLFITNSHECSNENISLLYEDNLSKPISITKSSKSHCSSRSSNTDHDESVNCESGSETSSREESYSDATEDETFIRICEFPVNVIALEQCENTLDFLLMNEAITEEILGSIVIQVLMNLITYQKVFGLTHNDLHANNIMYTKTDVKYLFYRYDNKHYRVPTFGRIFKIIDFGRAIYKFRGCVICSDSYHPKGDAATQYNCEPYFDDNKARLEPNFSFDLCRLGCALYDLMNDSSYFEIDNDSKIKTIIMKWCLDDKDRNILYKNNGEERYHEFKLYKMIARTVHNHIPRNVLKNETYFERYIVSKKTIRRKQSIMNIDSYDSYKEAF